MTRAEAKAAGLKYYDGKECPHGHGTLRFVRNWDCCECERVKDALRGERRRIEAAQKSIPRRLQSDPSFNPPQKLSKEAIYSRSRARGTEKAVRGDGRHDHVKAGAIAILNSFLEVPDFLARCEENIQAARSGR